MFLPTVAITLLVVHLDKMSHFLDKSLLKILSFITFFVKEKEIQSIFLRKFKCIYEIWRKNFLNAPRVKLNKKPRKSTGVLFNHFKNPKTAKLKQSKQELVEKGNESSR